MANNVKGEDAVQILRHPEIAKQFVNPDNPVPIEMVYGLHSWFLNNYDMHQIKKADKEHGETAAGAELHKCLIQHYTDEPDKFTLEQFIEVLQQYRTNITLANMLISECNAIELHTANSASAVFDNDKKQLPRIIKGLRNHYIKRFSKYQPSTLSDPFSIGNVWVNLSLRSMGRTLKSANCFEILKQTYQVDQFSLLIGQPGEGKTMTTKRIGYNWATEKLKDYDLVLCVPLREIHENCNSIFDMALQYMKNQNVFNDSDVLYLQAIRKNMIGEPKLNEDTDQLHVLIILDGYDEFNSTIQCEQLNQLLFSSDIPNLDHCVLVTSRPYAVEDVRSPVPKLVIEQLDEEEQTKYMIQHFEQESLDDSTDKVTQLKLLLAINPSLQDLAKTPMLLSFICILYKVLSPTDGAVQLYKLLLNAMVERYELKPAVIKSSMESLHGVFKDSFPNICSMSRPIFNIAQMALTGLISDNEHTQGPDKLQFTEDDLNKFQVDGNFCTAVGVLNIQFGQKMYEFPHKTIQEFFAALLLIYEISKCKEIKINQDARNPCISLSIKNRNKLFRHHPLIKNFFATTKNWALEPVFSFHLEMAADRTCTLNHSIVVQRKLCCFSHSDTEYKLSNTVCFFLAWTYRDNKEIRFTSPSMFRALLKQLPLCSDNNKDYLRMYLACDISNLYSSGFLLLQSTTCRTTVYSVDDVCFYIPDLDTLVIVEMTSSYRDLMSDSIPISCEQLKKKCGRTLFLCLVEFTEWEVLHKVCKTVGWSRIHYVKINIANISADRYVSMLSRFRGVTLTTIVRKLQVHDVKFIFKETVESSFGLVKFDFKLVSICFNSLFFFIRGLKIHSSENDLQVIGLDQFFGQSGIKNFLFHIRLENISFPNEQSVVSIAEQLKQYKSLGKFTILNDGLINEQHLFALLEAVKEAGVPDIGVSEKCLLQRETFSKFCSLLQRWHHLRYLGIGLLSSNLVDLLCDTLSQLPKMELLVSEPSNEMDKEHVKRLQRTNPNMKVIHN